MGTPLGSPHIRSSNRTAIRPIPFDKSHHAARRLRTFAKTRQQPFGGCRLCEVHCHPRSRSSLLRPQLAATPPLGSIAAEPYGGTVVAEDNSTTAPVRFQSFTSGPSSYGVSQRRTVLPDRSLQAFPVASRLPCRSSHPFETARRSELIESEVITRRRFRRRCVPAPPDRHRTSPALPMHGLSTTFVVTSLGDRSPTPTCGPLPFPSLLTSLAKETHRPTTGGGCWKFPG